MKRKEFDKYFEMMDEFNYRRYGQYEHKYAERNLDAAIKLDPHYSDPKFKDPNGITVFGDKSSDIVDYVYSDRLYQWDSVKYRESVEKANAETRFNTARWVQVLLSHYFDKPVEIKHIVSGVNAFSGYSYWCAGYK